MNKPYAFLCMPKISPLDDWDEYYERVSAYCRLAYEQGYIPVCPVAALPGYLDLDDADEAKDGNLYILDSLSRCSILIVCDHLNDDMREQTTTAKDYQIPILTFEGLLCTRKLFNEE